MTDTTAEDAHPAPACVTPDGFPRRSFVYRKLARAGAVFGERDRAAVALRFGTPEEDLKRARHMALADLSPLPRTGFKGAGAPEWLRRRKIGLPAEPNHAVCEPDGTVIARLAADEYLVLGDLPGTGGACERLDHAWLPDSALRCYRLPRRESHLWFTVTGGHVNSMLAKLCAVDLRRHRFGDGRVAQTPVAKVNAVVIRHDLGTTPAFHLLADSASGDYLWDCLVDAMTEFGGAPVGLEALLALGRGDAAASP